jgi:hypothetical protein
MIDYEALRAARVAREPYPHFATPNFLPNEEVSNAIADFPRIDMGGLFLPEFAPYGQAFDKLPKVLERQEVRRTWKNNATSTSRAARPWSPRAAIVRRKMAECKLKPNSSWRLCCSTLTRIGSTRAASCGCYAREPTLRTMPTRSRHLGGCLRFQDVSGLVARPQALHRPAPLCHAQLLPRPAVARPGGCSPPDVEPGEKIKAPVRHGPDFPSGLSSVTRCFSA